MRSRAFTLIELLVAISIIGILATLVSANLNQIRSRARDTARKSDIKQYSTSLESFANVNNGIYPSYLSGVDLASLCADLGIDSSGNCPDDPMLSPDPSYQPYRYVSSDGSDGGTVDATSYSLWADLESDTTDFWVLCSNGKVGISQIEPASANICPI